MPKNHWEKQKIDIIESAILKDSLIRIMLSGFKSLTVFITLFNKLNL